MSKHDAWTHDPFPYIVRLRITLDDDAAPETVERQVTAYSVFEAVVQAVMEATGGSAFDDSKIQVESISPDLPAYAQLLVSQADVVVERHA